MFRTYVVSSVLLVVACGGKRTGSPAGAGGSGGSGVAGMAGGGGASGGAGTSGMAGTTTGAAGTGVAGAGGAGPGGGAGTVGAGGASGAAGGASGAAGGASGAAGGASGTRFGAECRTAADCVLVSDCCACRAEPKGAQVATCLATCAVDACAAIQIEAREVTCTLDRCVLARTCDTRAVNCLADPASCPPGTVHSVRDRCWGPCLPPTECNHVAACSSCGAESVCVREQVTGGIAFGCVTPAPDCRAGNYCGCLEACPGLCAERDGGPECICGGC